MTEADILYANGSYWVRKNSKGSYEVIRDTITHGEVCATIGEGAGPTLGIDRARAECDKRAATDSNK